MQKKAVFIIPFAHLDLFWAGSREECLSRGAEIIQNALRLLEKHSSFHFMIEAVNFLEYFTDAYPEECEKLRKFESEGRLEVIPMRAILYTQLPSGETIVRNFLSGRKFCEKFFGASGKTATLSDIPGITPQMPQIAAKSGFSGLFLSHGLPPHTDRILYIAPDGTGIKAYAPIHYGRCRRLFHDAADYAQMCENEKEIEEIFGGVDYPQLCQFGTDLYLLNENAVENFRRWNEEGHRPFHFLTPAKYFSQEFPQNARRISGEIPSLWPNVESSWPDLWPLDLPAENAMLQAEFFGALNPQFFPRERMKTAWDALLDAMDHNQNGTGGEPADREKLDLKHFARLTAERTARELAMRIAARTAAPRKNCFPLVVFNRLSWKRSELVRARTSVYGPGIIRHPELHAQNYRVIDDAGNEVPFRLVRWLHGSADSFEVEFKAEVPAFAPRAYYLELAKPARQPDPFVIADSKDTERNWANQPLGKLSAENGFLRLEIDRATGRLTLFSKQEERCLFRDAEISGIEEMRGDYICNMPRTGRVVPAVADSIEIAEHTTVVCRFVIRGTVYGLPFEQKITLPAGLPELEIENTVHWKCGNYVRLVQSFPYPDAEPHEIEYGVPFGKVRYPDTVYKAGLNFSDIVTPERGNQPDHEIEHLRLAAQWIAFGREGKFTTIGCDHRLWEFKKNAVRACMVRGIGYCSGGVEILPDGSQKALQRPPDGEYTCRYRIRPGLVPQCGFELNAPLYPVGIGRCAAGETEPAVSALPDTTGTGIIGCAVKPAEESDDIAIRLFETSGIPERLALPEGEWLETDLMERNPVPAQNPLVFKPFEIKTIIRRRTH